MQYRGRLLKASELAATLGPESRKRLQEGEKRQWYFTCSVRIPDVQHKVRGVILWPSQEAVNPRIMLVSNRVRVYRPRWTGTETFPRDDKQPLGMGDCQLRTREGPTRHLYLVLLAYSLLMRQLRQGAA